MKTCTFPECDRRYTARGYCNGHYRQLKEGRPLARFAKDSPTDHRFWPKVDRSSECWVWTGSKDEKGYGLFRVGKQLLKAHRFSYAQKFGEIPSGEQLDHKCFNKACVNPSHLRIATNKQNKENHNGPRADSKSGVRGVYWVAKRNRWRVMVGHNSKSIHVGYFSNIEDAETAAIAKRNELFTHNLLDRKSS